MLAYEYLPPATKAVACTALRSQNLLLFLISPFFLIFFLLIYSCFAKNCL